jgi:hypothetical protein
VVDSATAGGYSSLNGGKLIVEHIEARQACAHAAKYNFFRFGYFSVIV